MRSWIPRLVREASVSYASVRRRSMGRLERSRERCPYPFFAELGERRPSVGGASPFHLPFPRASMVVVGSSSARIPDRGEFVPATRDDVVPCCSRHFRYFFRRLRGRLITRRTAIHAITRTARTRRPYVSSTPKSTTPAVRRVGALRLSARVYQRLLLALSLTV